MKKYDIQTLQQRDPVRLQQISGAVLHIQRIYRGHITRKDLARYFRKFHREKSRPEGDMTRRRDTFSVSGSGGFKFRRRTDVDFKKTSKPVMRTDPKLLQLIQEKGDYFQTLVSHDAEQMKVNSENLCDDSSVNTEDRLLVRHNANPVHQRRAYLRPNSFGAGVLSGKNVLKAASSGDRHFIIDKLKKASEARRKTNEAYVNPNVHQRPNFVVSGGTASTTSSQSGDDEVRNLLENVLMRG